MLVGTVDAAPKAPGGFACYEFQNYRLISSMKGGTADPTLTMTTEQKAILASTPGRILDEEFLKEAGLSQAELSRRTGIPRSTI